MEETRVWHPDLTSDFATTFQAQAGAIPARSIGDACGKPRDPFRRKEADAAGNFCDSVLTARRAGDEVFN